MAPKNRKAKNAAIHDDQLTAHLAEVILGWRAAPDRFIKSGRSWIPRWRFSPLTCLDDAFKLLDEAGADYYVSRTKNGRFTAAVRVGKGNGNAEGPEKARTIVMALVSALGVEI